MRINLAQPSPTSAPKADSVDRIVWAVIVLAITPIEIGLFVLLV